MTSYTREIAEGGGGYVDSGYVSTGYVVATQLTTDTLGRTYGSKRTLTPTITLSDSISRGIKRVITQSLTFVESLTRQIVAIRQIAQGTGGYTSSGYTSSGYVVDNVLSMIDTISRVRDVPRSLSQTVTITGIIANLGIGRFITTQASTFTETLDRTYNSMRTLSQTITNTNSVSRLLTASRTLTQTLTITELFVVFKGLAGEGARRIKEANAFLLKRIGTTQIFKRSGTTRT